MVARAAGNRKVLGSNPSWSKFFTHLAKMQKQYFSNLCLAKTGWKPKNVYIVTSSSTLSWVPHDSGSKWAWWSNHQVANRPNMSVSRCEGWLWNDVSHINTHRRRGLTEWKVCGNWDRARGRTAGIQIPSQLHVLETIVKYLINSEITIASVAQW